MKKIILFLMIVLFLTGCNATYEFSINDGRVKENLKLIETNKLLFDVRNEEGWTLRELFEPSLYEDEFSKQIYNIKSLNTNDTLGIKFSTDNLDSVLNSSILNQCYMDPVVEITDNIVTIETGNEFECYEYYNNLETIEVRFTSNHKIISTNSHLQDGDVYIWNFTKDSDKNIKISYDNSITYNKYKPLIIIGSIILVVGIIMLIYFIINKRKKENEI